MVISNVLQVLGKEPTYHRFKNLRNLVLDKCDLRDDFHTLGFFFQRSPYLEKLTLRQCQVHCLWFSFLTSHVTKIIHYLTSFMLHTVTKIF
jgi:hypothetical protein